MKVNVVDGAIVFIVIFSLAGLANVYHNNFNTTQVQGKKEWVEVVALSLHPSIIEPIYAVGDKGYNEFDNVDSEILEIISVDDAEIKEFLKETANHGNPPQLTDQAVVMRFKLLCGREKKTGILTFRKHRVKVGFYHSFIFTSRAYSMCSWILSGDLSGEK